MRLDFASFVILVETIDERQANLALVGQHERPLPLIQTKSESRVETQVGSTLLTGIGVVVTVNPRDDTHLAVARDDRIPFVFGRVHPRPGLRDKERGRRVPEGPLNMVWVVADAPDRIVSVVRVTRDDGIEEEQERLALPVEVRAVEWLDERTRDVTVVLDKLSSCEVDVRDLVGVDHDGDLEVALGRLNIPEEVQGSLVYRPALSRAGPQVKPLRELLDLRSRLNDLKGTLQTNEKLDQILLETVSNTEKLNKLRAETSGKKEEEGKEGSNGLEKRAKAPAQGGREQVRKRNSGISVEDGRVGTDVATREQGKNLVKEFIDQVLEGEVTVSKDVEAMINPRVAQIDHLLSIQLNEILHYPQLQNSSQPGAG